MNINQRIESLIEVFNELSQIPTDVFVSACAVLITTNNKTIWNVDKTIWKNNVDSIISEYWSTLYDMYKKEDCVWISAQDFSDQVYKELEKFSYFN